MYYNKSTLSDFKKRGIIIEELKELKQIMIEGFKQLNGEISGIRSDIADLKTDVAELKEDVTGLKEDVLRIEDTMHNKFGTLFDARQAQLECNFRVENTLTRIENKLDKAELKALGAFDLASRRVR